MSKTFHDDDGATPEEHELLHLYGFHEVRGLEGVWQRGRADVDAPVEPEGPYTLEEALEIVKREREE
jgi:hypothetical protein